MIYLITTIQQLLVNSANSISALVGCEYLINVMHYGAVSLSNHIFFAYFKVICRPRHWHSFKKVFQLKSFRAEFFDDCCFFALSCAASLSSLKAISFLSLRSRLSCIHFQLLTKLILHTRIRWVLEVFLCLLFSYQDYSIYDLSFCQ